MAHRGTTLWWRMAAVAGGTSIGSWTITPMGDRERVETTEDNSSISVFPMKMRTNQRLPPSTVPSLFSWVFRPVRTTLEGTENYPTTTKQPLQSDEGNTSLSRKSYDFVIVGNGIAGKSAVATLQKHCPHATIAVIDPTLQSHNDNHGRPASSTKNVDYYPGVAIGCHPLDHTVQFTGLSFGTTARKSSSSSSSSTPSAMSICYQHAVLVATGSRGAPPPHYLFDELALPRVLELRPTLLPNDNTNTTRQVDNSGGTNGQRPLWTAAWIRQTILRATARGDRVAILGSGWEAVELAAAAATARTKRQSMVTLMFGNKGPLSHVVPQYLSTAISKRFKSKDHVQILDRSLIRYVGSDHSQHNGKKNGDGETQQHTASPPKVTLEIYTAKSYDLLDSSRTTAEWLVVAPEVKGAMGTATLPTLKVPSYLEVAREGRAWYQTWSHLTKPPISSLDGDNDSVWQNAQPQSTALNLIACYADDGRIAVNGELYAGRGVYAAGSVAKYPNMWTGNADVAGVGLEDATQAGHVAAMNMSRDYHKQTGRNRQPGLFGFGTSSDNQSLLNSSSFVKDPIPVWRSDVSFQSHATKASNTNCLDDIGIQALCVGSCDSERFSTQGVWWTNQSQRVKQLFLEDDSDNSVAATRTSARRRRTTKLNRQSSPGGPVVKPVYGRGVVYYIDQDTGLIQGVMIWGLPFTNKNDKNNSLNQRLVALLKEVIQTNGGFSSIDSEEDRIRFVQYLTEQSKEIAVASLHGRGQSRVQVSDLPRALIRYTEVRPAGMRRVRVLQRKNDAQGHGFLGEDLFARTNTLHEDETPPGAMPDFDDLREADDIFSPVSGETKEERFAVRRSRTQAFRNWAVWEWYQRRWDENEDRARPPKEEMLWLRKGDEGRGVSAKEKFNESMMRAIFPEGR